MTEREEYYAVPQPSRHVYTNKEQEEIRQYCEEHGIDANRVNRLKHNTEIINYFDFIYSLSDVDLAYFLNRAGLDTELLKLAAYETMEKLGREEPEESKGLESWETLYRNMAKPRDYWR